MIHQPRLIVPAMDSTEQRRFYKMTGSGNDFVYLDGRYHSLADWPADRVRRVTNRRTGVGGDGLVILTPAPDGALRMVYLNADGSRAEMCGNAALCAARLAERLGLARPERVTLETDSGRLETRCVGTAWGAELEFPSAELPTPLELDRLPGERRAFHGTVGVPHLVILVDDVEAVDVVSRGRELREAPRFGPQGTNVNFLSRVDGPAAGWSVRTYERGVEGETLACGTGTVAAALTLVRAGEAELPVLIRSRGGEVYSVSGQPSGDLVTTIWLRGEGRLVFSGILES